MNDKELSLLLQELSRLPKETEWVEFKLNRGSVTNEQIGEYISALSTEEKAYEHFGSVSIHSEKVAQYVKNKGFDKTYYKKLILEYLKKQGIKGTEKSDITNLLWSKLPDILDEEQKNIKLGIYYKNYDKKELFKMMA